MAKSVQRGKRGTGTKHVGKCVLIGILISHDQATVQTVRVWDNTAASGTLVLDIDVDPTRSPWSLFLPRDLAIPFSTGLHVESTNCNVNVWFVSW